MTIQQEAINAVFQVGVGLSLSVLIWCLSWIILSIRRKDKDNYFSWVGFQIPSRQSLRLTILIMGFLIPLSIVTSVFGPLRELSSAQGTVVYQVQQMGISYETFIVIVLIAVFKTSLSEEIVFRGVLAKRLINWWGFQIGNLVQALIFAVIHLPLFFLPGAPEFQISLVALLIARIGLSGWLMGWINHRSGGSILPSWILHGSMNALFYPILAFIPLGL